MKKSKLGLSFVALSVLFVYACAGSVEGSDPSEWSEADDTVEADAADEEDAAPEEASSSGEAVELGQLRQRLGGSCGSESSVFNTIVTRVAVPDHFPPDSALAQIAAVAIGVPFGALPACAAFGVARLSPTCDVHDACYATFGASKSACDRAARSGWEAACRRTYDSIDLIDVGFGILTGGISSSVALAEQACRESCLAMADTMFAAISSGGQGAFDSAQRQASSPTVDRAPQGPIFF